MPLSISTGDARTLGFASHLPAVLAPNRIESSREIYEQNRQRVYSLAFWMTDNELAAEELMTRAFCQAFACCETPTAGDVDRALVAELRLSFDLGALTLDCAPCDRVLAVRSNTLRVELERAVVQLPAAEKLMFLFHDVEGYDHARIAHLLGTTQDGSRRGVHQARLRLRELLAHC
jgi:RNA polymerase sigma-70 factor, ECF subfamily